MFLLAEYIIHPTLGPTFFLSTITNFHNWHPVQSSFSFPSDDSSNRLPHSYFPRSFFASTKTSLHEFDKPFHPRLFHVDSPANYASSRKKESGYYSRVLLVIRSFRLREIPSTRNALSQSYVQISTGFLPATVKRDCRCELRRRKKKKRKRELHRISIFYFLLFVFSTIEQDLCNLNETRQIDSLYGYI